MKIRKYGAPLMMSLVLGGCSAALVPTTSDPQQKIAQAYQLLQLFRPLPAKKLIDESMAIYSQRGDDKGLGYAYTALADYDQYLTHVDSRVAVGQALPPQINMSKVASLPPGPEAIATLKKSEQFYISALAKEKQSLAYFDASNTYWRLSGVYSRLQQSPEVCESLDASYEMSVLGRKAHPEVRSETYGKFSNYKDLIDSAKKEIPCPAGGQDASRQP